MYTVYWRYKPLRIATPIAIVISYFYNTNVVGMSWIDWLLFIPLALVAGEIIVRYIMGKFNVNND